MFLGVLGRLNVKFEKVNKCRKDKMKNMHRGSEKEWKSGLAAGQSKGAAPLLPPSLQQAHPPPCGLRISALQVQP